MVCLYRNLIIFFFFLIALTLPKPVVITITKASLTFKALRFPHTAFFNIDVFDKVKNDYLPL